MEIFIIGLVIIVLGVDVYSFKQIRQGLTATKLLDNECGWVGYNMLLCIGIGTLFTLGYYFLGGTILDAEGVPWILEDYIAVFLVFGAIIWIANMIILSIVVNCCLEGYIEYKQGCLRLNLDLKDNVNKYFVLTSRTDFNVETKDGLRRDTRVNLHKVMYNRSWLGEYPYLNKVTTLVTLADVELQKDTISEYVQKYFDARGQYEVDGGDLIAMEDKPMDVIVIK